MEKLDFLIDYLLKENTRVQIEEMPKDLELKKNLYRSLVNIRDAKPISEEYIKIENEYLTEELQNKELTDVQNLSSNDKICLWKGDITTLKIDSIVNAANSQGLGCFVPCHKCIDNQIQTYAGVSLRLECNDVMKELNYNLPTGKAFITKGYNLPSKYVIHTVGPIIYSEVTELEEKQLADCYINSLRLAIQNNIRTIAFPCISTGEFRFPKAKACEIAVETVKEFLKENGDKFDKIVFNVYGEEDYYEYRKLLKS